MTIVPARGASSFSSFNQFTSFRIPLFSLPVFLFFFYLEESLSRVFWMHLSAQNQGLLHIVNLFTQSASSLSVRVCSKVKFLYMRECVCKKSSHSYVPGPWRVVSTRRHVRAINLNSHYTGLSNTF